ncbi:hypothetical protein POM88_041236 [Heracleum sosnowskyi]|uniref:CCHC-type domain-containing protein n=1 Tax=Heracleum sosnowskyi TaxID=360622 RepID=A0AAD8HDU1_9APIA|nr:hypothetical protein POM88_041236 [Heracleum sosnowskyi]
MSWHSVTDSSPAARRAPRVIVIGRPPSSSSDSDPSEDTIAEIPTPVERAGPSRPVRYQPMHQDPVVKRDQIPCPIPLRQVAPAPVSQASVCGPLYQLCEPPVPHHVYQRVSREKEYLYGQVMEMGRIRSIEAAAVRERDRLRDQMRDIQMRFRVTRTLVETRLHGLASSREGETVAGMRQILDYAMSEIAEISGPPLWPAGAGDLDMAPRRQTRSTDTSDQEGQQNTPPTGRVDPMQQHQQHQHQQHQQQHQQAAPTVTFKSFQAAKPPEFKGSADPVEAKAWLKEMEKAFTLIEVTEDKKTEYASYFLKNEASYWWETSRAMEPEGLITWARFTELFLERYFPDYMRDQMELKFLELKQGSMTVPQYETRFTELSRFVPTYVDTEKKKAKRFQQGLRSWIRSKLAVLELDTYAAVVQKAMIAETESDSYMKERENKKRKAGIPDKGQQQGSFQGQANKKLGFQHGRNTSFRKPDTGNVGQDNRLLTGSQQGLSRPPLPECKTCGKRHLGICHRLNVTCFKCNQKGHYSRDCKIGIVCHRCKKPGHMIKDCRAPATVNNMIRAIEAPPVVNVQSLARTYNMSM